jgi:hypothetical protein
MNLATWQCRFKCIHRRLIFTVEARQGKVSFLAARTIYLDYLLRTANLFLGSLVKTLAKAALNRIQ